MKVHATGPRHGKTFTWKANPTSDRTYEFVDGVCDLYQFPANELPTVLHYLRVNLQVLTDTEVLVQSGPAPTSEKTEQAKVEESDPIRLAIINLDTSNEDNWTPQGAPAIAALSATIPGITRKAVDAVASDLTRSVVASLK